jgi:hypothetical protein
MTTRKKKMEKFCKRCKKNPVAPPRITIKGKLIPRVRCEECLDYARTWQKGITAKRRNNDECITCGDPTVGSRCDRCTELKAQNYFETREAALAS